MGLAANGLGYNQVPVAAALHIADLVVTVMVVYPHLIFSSAVPLPRLFPDDLPGFSLDQAVHLFQLRNNGLHLLGEPAEAGVTVVAAAGGLLTVTVEEGPIGRQPELLPQPVFLKDSLPQFLGGNRKQFAGRCNADTGIQPKLLAASHWPLRESVTPSCVAAWPSRAAVRSTTGNLRACPSRRMAAAYCWRWA